MPLYEYKCPCCGKELEVRCSFDESEELHICPDCNYIMERQMGTIATFSIKGKR